MGHRGRSPNLVLSVETVLRTLHEARTVHNYRGGRGRGMGTL